MADPPNQTNKKKSFIQKKSFFKKIYEIIWLIIISLF
jgi:hypothetical protein